MSIKLSPAKALAYAQASQRIEGLTMSAADVAIGRKMLAGTLSYDAARAQIIASAKVKKVAKTPAKADTLKRVNALAR